MNEHSSVELLNSLLPGTTMETLGIQIIEADREHLVATMPIGPQHRQPLGYLHGGISITLAETLASLGSLLHIDPARQMAFGLEINASHLRAKKEGLVTGTAVPLRLGRSAHVWDVRLTDEAGKLICVARCTIAVTDRRPTA